MPAYHRALELKPKYARGWLNLGISHANTASYMVCNLRVGKRSVHHPQRKENAMHTDVFDCISTDILWE